MTQASHSRFLEERRRTRRIFNRLSPLYPIVERHLFPEYRRALDRIDLPPELRVLDLATGTGPLAGAFSERGHAVSGLDFADKLLIPKSTPTPSGLQLSGAKRPASSRRSSSRT